MALRNIRVDDDPILRKNSRPVEKFDDRLRILIEDMFDTMYEANGVGLAGVQVGVLRRVVVIDTGEPDECLVLVNPEILEVSGEQTGAEGCLSLPGRSGIVCRPDTVTVKAQNENGEEYTVTGHGLLARALCHEIDHLSGILYTDKMIRECGEDE